MSPKMFIFILKRSLFPCGLADLQLILVPWNIGVSLVGLIFKTNINYSCISICQQRRGICEHGLHPHHTLIKAECILARAVHSIILTLPMSRYINHRLFIYIWKAEHCMATVYIACVICFSTWTCDIDACAVLEDIRHFNEVSYFLEY